MTRRNVNSTIGSAVLRDAYHDVPRHLFGSAQLQTWFVIRRRVNDLMRSVYFALGRIDKIPPRNAAAYFTIFVG